jgi:YD repeat-containing protein
MAKILTSENVNGVTETFEFDEAEQLVGVRHTQDVTSRSSTTSPRPISKACARSRAWRPAV